MISANVCRLKEEPDKPEQVSGNKLLEIIWTIVPFLILILVPIIFYKGERSPCSVGIVVIIVTMVIEFLYIGSKLPGSASFEIKKLPAEVIGKVKEDAKNGADFLCKKACIY
jgi:quinol-cytochrome oxidoreductase complex cytochrome b subunit